MAPLQVALEAVVRQIQRTVFNGSPVVKAGKPVTESNGDVTGTVDATDPEGDSLSYRVVGGPSGGTVTVKPDGSYAYTPSAAHQITGGVDSFVIAVTDTGRHLHLFQGNGTTRITVSVFTEGTGEDPGNLGTTEGFNIYNLSSKPLTFDHTDGDNPKSAPPIGTVIQPGQYAHFEVGYAPAKSGEVRAWFGAPDGYYAAQMAAAAFTGVTKVKCLASSSGSCGPTDWQDARTVRFFDLPGTVIEIGPDNPQAQTEVLEYVCKDEKTGTCSFKATGEDKTYTAFAPYTAFSNNTSLDQHFETLVSVDETHTNSLVVGTKLSVTLIKIVNAELSATYTHTWTRTTSYSEKFPIDAKPYTRVTLSVQEPMFRDHGDFTVQMGNTTWKITDVTFDSPDPSRGLQSSVKDSPLSAPGQTSGDVSTTV
ncbi:Ig-like domain-containing protein [Mycobacterium sp. shizuoka-1]|uniref:Ig-like domain-containing protein n=1 Tax=Mycobacterium sp. shizuoka-1 TaxID=2039281 RepID=UPI000C083D58|nr:Ig-like domain-containing protein [Mycobacterium sp. shizuoka-1]